MKRALVDQSLRIESQPSCHNTFAVFEGGVPCLPLLATYAKSVRSGYSSAPFWITDSSGPRLAEPNIGYSNVGASTHIEKSQTRSSPRRYSGSIGRLLSLKMRYTSMHGTLAPKLYPVRWMAE